MRTALFTLGVFALLSVGNAAAASRNDGTMSARNLAAYPTCVVYRGDHGWMAHIQGAVVDATGAPVGDARPVLRASDGRVFHPTTNDAGYFILDVAVHPHAGHPLVIQIDGSRARMACLSPRVTVG